MYYNTLHLYIQSYNMSMLCFAQSVTSGMYWRHNTAWNLACVYYVRILLCCILWVALRVSPVVAWAGTGTGGLMWERIAWPMPFLFCVRGMDSRPLIYCYTIKYRICRIKKFQKKFQNIKYHIKVLSLCH